MGSSRGAAAVLGALAVVAVGCAVRPAGGPPGPNALADADQVRAARGRWNAAIAARDTAAVAALVADSVVQVSPFLAISGRGPYVALLARVLSRRPGLTWEYTPDRVDVSTAPGTPVAAEAGRWREAWAEGGEATELRGTYYAVWRRRNGAWELVREAFTPLTCTGARYCGR